MKYVDGAYSKYEVLVGEQGRDVFFDVRVLCSCVICDGGYIQWRGRGKQCFQDGKWKVVRLLTNYISYIAWPRHIIIPINCN